MAHRQLSPRGTATRSRADKPPRPARVAPAGKARAPRNPRAAVRRAAISASEASLGSPSWRLMSPARKRGRPGG
eukprot:14342830-Alexandrium_andersonii.AAC.1